MRLVYLTANGQWAFVFGDSPCRFYTLHNEELPLFYSTRAAALETARIVGLVVADNGSVQTLEAANLP